jgi:four helix bundle protein
VIWIAESVVVSTSHHCSFGDVLKGFAENTLLLTGTPVAPRSAMTRQQLEKRSLKFSVDVKHLCEELRKQPIAWGTAAQLLDAATSMATNYRATARSRSRAEWVAKLGVVAEEADEAVHWLEFTAASKMADEQRIEPLLAEAIELRAIFAASYATSRRNRGKRHRPDQ